MKINHMNVSFIKSGVRIGAGALLMCTGDTIITAAGFTLILAEILGILEEVVDKRKEK